MPLPRVKDQRFIPKASRALSRYREPNAGGLRGKEQDPANTSRHHSPPVESGGRGGEVSESPGALAGSRSSYIHQKDGHEERAGT